MLPHMYKSSPRASSLIVGVLQGEGRCHPSSRKYRSKLGGYMKTSGGRHIHFQGHFAERRKRQKAPDNSIRCSSISLSSARCSPLSFSSFQPFLLPPNDHNLLCYDCSIHLFIKIARKSFKTSSHFPHCCTLYLSHDHP